MLFDLYQPGNHWLHRLDPRVKLLFVAVVVTLLLLNQNLWLTICALVLLQAMLLSSGIGWRRIAWVWRMAWPMMAMIAILWALFTRGKGPVIWQWWILQLSWHAAAQGMAVALRIGALAFSFFSLLFTTDQSRLVRGMVALGLPYDWGLTLALAFRYLPTMASTFRMVSDAQQARGLDLGGRNPVRRARAYLPVTVAMLITALRTSESLGYALESRALGAAPRRTYLHSLEIRRADVLFALCVLLVAALLLWAGVAWGLGAQPLRLLAL